MSGNPAMREQEGAVRCSSKGKSPGSLPATLRRQVTELAKRIRKKHGPLDRDMADRAARLLKSSIVKRKKPGRKTTPEVLKAVELRREKKPWPTVFEAVIPGYWKMDYPERFWRTHRLRDAVRAHRRRNGQKALAERPPDQEA